MGSYNIYDLILMSYILSLQDHVFFKILVYDHRTATQAVSFFSFIRSLKALLNCVQKEFGK